MQEMRALLESPLRHYHHDNRATATTTIKRLLSIFPARDRRQGDLRVQIVPAAAHGASASAAAAGLWFDEGIVRAATPDPPWVCPTAHDLAVYPCVCGSFTMTSVSSELCVHLFSQTPR